MSSKVQGNVEIFETPDEEVDEEVEMMQDVDSNAETVDEKSVNMDIDRTRLEPGSAFNAFADMERCRVYKSYSARPSTGVESIGRENPAKKFERLKNQVAEFMKELDRLAGDEKEEKKLWSAGSAEEVAEASKGAYVLRQRLEALETDAKLRKFVDPDHYAKCALDNQEHLSSQLLRDIKTFDDSRESSADAKEAGEKEISRQSHLTYELYYEGAARSNKTDVLGRGVNVVASLEKRLNRLEESVGTSSSTEANDARPLASVVSDMERRVQLLDTKTLDALSRRMKSVASEYETFARRMARARSKSGGVANPLRVQKLSKALEKIELFEEQSAILPTIIERLKTLRAIHEESARYHHRLESIERAQTTTLVALEESERAIGNVENALKESMKTVAKNVTYLDKRIGTVLNESP